MSGKTLLFLAVILAAGYWFYTNKIKPEMRPTGPAPLAEGETEDVGGCIQAAERANSVLHDTGMLLMRLPVSQTAWADAENRTSSEISSAESACAGGNAALFEAQKALSLMKDALSDMSKAAKGGGGATNLAVTQRDIDEHISRAKVAAGR